MKKLFVVLSFGLLSLGAFVSCASILERDSPYTVGDVKFLLGNEDKKDGFNFAGVSFIFYNSSQKTVKDFSVSFRLYDEEGENPFIGTNCVSATSKEMILSNSTSKTVINLDNFITVVPESAYQIDYFYVSEINYTDGSNWKDEYGIYAL